jgi:hypothetical protein
VKETSSHLTPFLVSTQGSGRATAYSEQPKIISANGKTHVAWLDAGSEGFRVRVRTLDQATGEWSSTITVGEAQDNHGGPGLTIDSQGHLHIIFYPHHEQFRHRRSTRPHDISEWEPEIRFGEALSFPTVVCTPDDKLILTARRGAERQEPDSDLHVAPFTQELWEKPVAGDWRYMSTLIVSRVVDYAQFATALAWGPDHRTLHLNCRIYERLSSKENTALTTIGYLVSPDAGKTWTKSDGTPVTLPVTGDNIEAIAKGDPDNGINLCSGPLSVDPFGTPYLIYNSDHGETSPLILASLDSHAGWNRRDLTPYLPKAWRNHRCILGMGGGITFSDSGQSSIIAALVKLPNEESSYVLAKEWGHGNTEIVRLWSEDGMQSFQSEIITPNATRAHWLPNIERSTAHHQVPDIPGIIFTKGEAGGGLHDLALGNEVWWHPKN